MIYHMVFHACFFIAAHSVAHRHELSPSTKKPEPAEAVPPLVQEDAVEQEAAVKAQAHDDPFYVEPGTEDLVDQVIFGKNEVPPEIFD